MRPASVRVARRSVAVLLVTTSSHARCCTPGPAPAQVFIRALAWPVSIAPHSTPGKMTKCKERVRASIPHCSARAFALLHRAHIHVFLQYRSGLSAASYLPVIVHLILRPPSLAVSSPFTAASDAPCRDPPPPPHCLAASSPTRLTQIATRCRLPPPPTYPFAPPHCSHFASRANWAYIRAHVCAVSATPHTLRPVTGCIFFLTIQDRAGA